MKIVIPDHFDHVFNAPHGWRPTRDGDCAGLPVRITRDEHHTMMTSFWRPSPDDLAALNAGACVSLTVLGLSHPVVALGVEHVDEMKIPKEVFGG